MDCCETKLLSSGSVAAAVPVISYQCRDAECVMPNAGCDMAASSQLHVCTAGCLLPRMLCTLITRCILFGGESRWHTHHAVLQMHEEHVDASVLNRTALGLAEGARVPRTAARVSLTVRRVGRVIKGLAVGRPA